MTTNPNIVIVGGGYGGIAVATKLESSLHKTHQIILIERKTHFYHSIGGLRTVVEDGFEKKVIVDTETELGTHIPFKYLIIATGSNHSKPAKMIKKRVPWALVELAGEIASVYQDKEVTLIHAENHLLTDKFPKKMTDLLAKQLRELNVKLIFGEKGTQIESDVQFVAFGAKPNTEVIITLDQSLIEQHTTLVKVKPTLQLENDNYAHIFALGDITNIKETKLAYRAGLHADVVTKNIIALINNKKLVEYSPGAEAMLVTIGKNKGASLLPMGNMVVGSFMTKNIKGKTLIVDKTWKSLNATPAA
ncbi:479_t:CDS:2 [Dentiscutata erythropus]|uniref:479_t:CDS:1 n=1 Tax=Dentiscutata erythropus TaxID=1348616 RepID=A0A9N9JT41_9GLOM|nr:479_t:CDS:2 [Dentiscutata erythropus]